MALVTKDTHEARGRLYELAVYRVHEAGEHRVYMAWADLETVMDGKAVGTDVVAILLQAARGEIDRNELAG